MMQYLQICIAVLLQCLRIEHVTLMAVVRPQHSDCCVCNSKMLFCTKVLDGQSQRNKMKNVTKLIRLHFLHGGHANF